jgi:hypothetical protein
MNAAMEYVSNKAYETLVIRAQDGDETAMVEILDDFEYRVEAVARQVVHRCRRANILDFDDLKQEGYAAIVRAVHEYSPDDDFNFTARVVMSIYWSAWGAVWNASWLSRSASAILKASRSDESLTFEEIAERAGCTVGRVRAVLAAAVVPVSLDCPLSDDRDDSHGRGGHAETSRPGPLRFRAPPGRCAVRRDCGGDRHYTRYRKPPFGARQEAVTRGVGRVAQRGDDLIQGCLRAPLEIMGRAHQAAYKRREG